MRTALTSMLSANEWLRLRLIGIVVCILVAGFGITNVVSYRNAVGVLKATILHNELPLTGSNIYSEVQSDLIRPVFISSVMATDTFVKDWLLAGEEDTDRITRYLDAIRDRYGIFTSFLISDRTHRYYRFSGGDRRVSADNPEDAWYYRVRSMTAPYEINIDVDQSSNRTLTIFVNYRILDYQGRFLGVTGVGLNIESVRRIVDRYQKNFQRAVYFVARTGEVTVTSDSGPPAGAILTAQPGIGAIARQMLSSPEGQYEYRRDGETYLLDTRFIPELDWYVVVEQRQADATRNLWECFLTNMWIGLAIILATSAVIGWAVSVYHRRLSHLARTDKLTGLANREALDELLQRLARPGRSTRGRFAVLLLDIDHFKRINDTLGHLRGDRVIQDVAAAVVATVRRSDLVCRWGGEELMVVLRDCDLAEAAVIGEKLRAAVERVPLSPGDDMAPVTASIGVTSWRDGDTVDALLTRVDRALYQAKREGRNRVRIAQSVPVLAEVDA